MIYCLLCNLTNSDMAMTVTLSLDHSGYLKETIFGLFLNRFRSQSFRKNGELSVLRIIGLCAVVQN